MIEDKQIKEWYQRTKDKNKNEIAKILNVEYAHLLLENKDDLYITKYGLPFIENLRPENFWTDKTWFNENSERLSGTSCVYKTRTKKVKGVHKDIVIKWNRMGQDVLVADYSDELLNAEFNSPFEEFSLVMELRNEVANSPEKIIIQKPLAIYVPSEHVALEQIGRKEYKMRLKIQAHKEIELDMYRSYAVIYEWIHGVDAVQGLKNGILEKKYLGPLTLNAYGRIKRKGFIVRDRKPHHIIVRSKKDNELAKDKGGKNLYGLVDFELLERTPERAEMVKRIRRSDYLKRQRDRFIPEMPEKFHPHLKHVNIFGVDYVYGHVESTKGRLWVVGQDPYLFDYFLPEEWERTPKTKISVSSETYYTVTKDNIHVVWKVSKVGLQPNMDPLREDERRILEYGYNSPFEEVLFALELSSKGVATIYPRAIYMTGHKRETSGIPADDRRYESHKDFTTPDRVPALKKNHDYIIIWGFWNGPDEKLAAKDGDYYKGIDALRAYKKGIIAWERYVALLKIAKEKLAQAGLVDFNLRGNHLLLTLDSAGALIIDEQAIPEIRICNFKFLKRTE